MNRGVSIVIAMIIGWLGFLVWVAMAGIIDPWIPESAPVDMDVFYSRMELLPGMFLIGMVSLLTFAVARLRG